jgi:hypothetical protein
MTTQGAATDLDTSDKRGVKRDRDEGDGSGGGGSVRGDSDRGGFPPGDLFYRSGVLPRGCPEGGSSAEYDRVMATGGDFITRECSLGKNVEGTRELLVPAMVAGEELISVARGRHESLAKAMVAAGKELCMRFGRNNVARCHFWKDLDGSVRPDYDNSGCVLRVFCDNMLLDTLLENGPKGNGDVYHLMRLLGFETPKRSAEDLCGGEDTGAMSKLFSVCSCGKAEGRYRWKMSLADVPLPRVALVTRILDFAESHRSSSVFSFPDEMGEIMLAHREAIAGLGATEGDLFHAAEVAQLLFWVNIDLGVDSSGTQNSDAVRSADMLRLAGVNVSPRTDGGANCVYFEAFEEDRVSVRMKMYNKPSETMQQGNGVRSTMPGNKCGYLLNPTTRRLADLSRDSAYFENGTTRLELTLSRSSPTDGIPSFDRCVALVERWESLLSEPGVLVSCSIHDHIALMGTYVGRSIAVYWPSISDAKRERWSAAHNSATEQGKSQLRKRKDELPDGLFFSWNNPDTRKFVGYSIHGHCAGQGHRSETGWDRTARALAWASSSKQPPCLFVCVAGDTGHGLAHMYFRQVDLARTGSQLSTYLPWHSDFTKGNYKNHVMDFGRLGVRPDEQDNLRFKLVDPSVVPSFKTMGGLDIELSSASEAADDWTVVDSEARAAVTGVPRRYHQVKDHNGALNTWTPWKSYKACGDSRIRFQVGRDWFWVPPGVLSKQLIEHLKGSPLSVCEVLMDADNNLRWRVAGVASGSKVVGRCHAARELPVDASPYVILGGGLEHVGRRMGIYMSVASGRYFAPQSVREQVFAAISLSETDANCDEAVDAFLRGKLIQHPARRFERVRGQTNCEELLSIVDPSGSVHATNVGERLKRQRR